MKPLFFYSSYLFLFLFLQIWAVEPASTQADFLQGKDKQDLTLQSFFQESEVGEYIVTKIGKTLTLVHIAAKNSQYLLLEEISFAEKIFPEIQNNWNLWLKNKAPKHQCWNLVEFDLITGKISESFSITQNKHIQICPQESPIAQLFKQPLEEVSFMDRRKIGPAPNDGELDTRKIWTPPFIFEGKKQTSSQFEVLKTLWPKDSSPLSQRPVTMYFDKERKIHFPIWIDAETSHVLGKIQVLDSGKNLVSPYKKIPKKAMAIKKVEKDKQNLVLNCSCPSYFKEFYLYVIYNLDNEKHIQSIEDFTLNQNDHELLVSINLDTKNAIPCNTPFEIILGPVGFDNRFAANYKYNLKSQ